MSRVEVQVLGADRVAAQFTALGFKSRDLSAVFQRIGSKVSQEARVMAPKRTGALAADVRFGRAKTRATISVGRKSVPYAGPINYGWRKRGIEPSLFMNRAANDEAEPSADLIVREMRRLINSVGLG